MVETILEMLGMVNLCLINRLDLSERHFTMKQMCAASANENGFVMNSDEAYNLIKET